MNSPPQASVNTLIAAFQRGHFDEAVRVAQMITQREPGNGFAWNALGNALARLGRIAEAVVAFRRAAEMNPRDADLYGNLGLALSRIGRLDEAEASYRRALEINPADPSTYDGLGLVLLGLRRFDEARSCHEAALRIAPGFAEAHNNIGVVYRSLDQLDRAEAHFRRAVELKPGYAEAHNNLGGVLHELQRSWEADPCFRTALQLQPGYANALGNLGAVLSNLGQFDEAESCLRRALEMRPDDLNVRSGLIFHHSYTDHDESRQRTEIEEYGRIVAARVKDRFSTWRCPATPSALRVGLVSGDLREHPVGHFLEQVLANVDPTRVQLFAYPTNGRSDRLTERIRGRFAAWRPLAGVDDAQAARLIHGDGIHVLLDLAGHTMGNRLPVFARKPAPVQASWLGYFASTGVADIDYFIADRYCLPENSAQYFVEKIYYLPETRWCFTPPADELPVERLPALDQGTLTFCCFNNLMKLNDAVVATWSRVLEAVPGSRLLLKAHQLSAASQRQRVIARFLSCGIPGDRLILEGPSARREYLATYRRADIALDPFPFSGGTTTVESLWMGVPVLTLAGNRLVSRQGVSLLMNVGLQDWIATDPDDYVGKAAGHARDLVALARLRKGLRDRVLGSPVCDGARFARHLNDAFFAMWSNAAATATPPRTTGA